MSDDRTNIDAALVAFEKLIADELASDRASKYDRVAQLSNQASQLRRLYVTRVKQAYRSAGVTAIYERRA